ncbi:hypothetical protein Ddye_022184 [Dipteronia dyeriana]|uniref:S-locus glycoprotein domain-containing protein n=1 Tax=Dipteronia dyeriana TaxID=168575 RepID=A0AAD9U354_9ROSI|nr:hypothetical protein Ddye_022184 [Dipteronia dyeriana]
MVRDDERSSGMVTDDERSGGMPTPPHFVKAASTTRINGGGETMRVTIEAAGCFTAMMDEFGVSGQSGWLVGRVRAIGNSWTNWGYFSLRVFLSFRVVYNHPLTQPYIHAQQTPKPVEINLKAFSFQELREATNDFKNRIGRGGFSTVYAGVLTLDGEEVEVAVKKLEKDTTSLCSGSTCELVWSSWPNIFKYRLSRAEARSTVQLTDAGRLLLNYFNGIVRSIGSGVAASFGLMKDDDNFVLKDPNSALIWQSFGSPTDTILRGQVLAKGQRLFSNSKGTIDYSTGNYMSEMQSFDRKLVLSAYRFVDPGYWLTDTQGENRSLVFSPSGFLYIVNSSNDNIYSLTRNIPTPAEDYYHRATINDHGNFQQFVHYKNGSNWTLVWSPFDEPCTANSICGVYGMFSSPDNETETCNYLPGHTPLDPDNVFEGCRHETVMNYSAENSRDNYTVELIEDADFVSDSLGDLGQVDHVDMEECKKAIMDNCYSLAAYCVNSTCRKKRTPLVNAKNSVSTKGIMALIKVPIKTGNPDIEKPTNKKKFNSRAFLEIGSIISATLAFLFGVTAIYYNPVAQRFIKRNYGVMLLEIICGRRHIELDRVEEESEEDDLFLPGWVVSCVISGKLEMVVSHDPEALSDFQRFERMAMVGLWCINPDPIMRPSMNRVVQMLEGTLEVGIPPLIHDHM